MWEDSELELHFCYRMQFMEDTDTSGHCKKICGKAVKGVKNDPQNTCVKVWLFISRKYLK